MTAEGWVSAREEMHRLCGSVRPCYHSPMETREHLHALVDTLPEEEMHVAVRFLEFLESGRDVQLWSMMDAPPDEEPVSPEEQRALAEAQEDLARGHVVPHAEARRRLLGES